MLVYGIVFVIGIDSFGSNYNVDGMFGVFFMILIDYINYWFIKWVGIFCEEFISFWLVDM